jgi:hypothetical protein
MSVGRNKPFLFIFAKGKLSIADVPEATEDRVNDEATRRWK